MGSGQADLSAQLKAPCLVSLLQGFVAIFLPYYRSWEIFEQLLLHMNPVCMFTCRFSLEL